MLNYVLYDYYGRNHNNFEKREIGNFDLYRLNNYFKGFPFIILLIKNKDSVKSNTNNYLKIDLSISDIDRKNACIYNKR